MGKIILIGLIAAVIMWLAYKPVTAGSQVRRDVRKKGADTDENLGMTVLLLVLGAGLLVRLIAAAVYRGHETDMNCFVGWADYAVNNGFKTFYTGQGFADYPPGYIYILYVCGALRKLFGCEWGSTMTNVITKLPAILADIGTGYLIYRVASRRFTRVSSSWIAALYLFNPIVILDGAVWGQTDGVFTFFLVWMVYLITQKKLIPSYFVFALSILIKPQSLMLAPVLILAIIDQVFLEDFNWKKFGINLGLGLAAIGVIGLLMLPFGFSEALKQYTETLGSYEYCSVNAYNFWALIGKNWHAQTETLLGIQARIWGSAFLILTVVASIVLGIRCKKDESKYYYFGAFIYILVFSLSVRMHERYIFPAVVMLLLAYCAKPRKDTYISYMAVSLVAFFNCAYALFFYDATWETIDNGPVKFTALCCVCMVAWFIWNTISGYSKENLETAQVQAAGSQTKNRSGSRSLTRREQQKAQEHQTDRYFKPSAPAVKMLKWDFIMVAVITLVYAVVAFTNLGDMDAPQTEYSSFEQGAITLDFGETVNIDKIWDYLGYQNNYGYSILYTQDPAAGWTALYDGTNGKWDSGSVFKWNDTQISLQTRYLQIAAVDGYRDSLMELAFTDATGNLLEPVNAGDYATLFDEQDLFTGEATKMNGTYFDEIYHGRTAYEMIHKLYCYENTHPPLGKELMAVGVMIFGMCPFGWRFMGTLFGVIMLPFMYLFAKKMFKETWISAITTILFAFDFMHFTQTRIATIDVFVTTFIIISYYFMYCYTQMNFYDTKLSKTFVPLGLCGVAMGLGWASKWTGIYASAGLAVIFFVQMGRRFVEYLQAAKNPKGTTLGISHQEVVDTFIPKFWKTIGFCCIAFVAVPVLIYVLSYIPFNDGTDRTLIQKVIQAQKTMFDYHSNLDAEHPYSSTWWQWPIMYRPMWYYSRVISGTVREGISAFGNPLVWWAGIPAFAYMLYLSIARRDRNAIFLSLGYLSQYAPWFLVTRVVFIYHYFPSVPFVTIMIGYTMFRLVQAHPKWKKYMFIYTALAVGLFIMFYPVISGSPCTVSYAEHFLKWFKSWVLLQTW